MTPSSLTPQNPAATTNENIQRCISTIAAWRQTAGRDGLLPSSVMKDLCLRRVLISTSSSAWWLQQHDTSVDLLYFPELLHFPNFPMRAHCRMRWAAAIQHDEVPCLSRQWISKYRIYFTTWIPSGASSYKNGIVDICPTCGHYHLM